MKIIGNILWLVLAGFWMAIAKVIAGILQRLFGIQSFKAGRPTFRSPSKISAL